MEKILRNMPYNEWIKFNEFVIKEAKRNKKNGNYMSFDSNGAFIFIYNKEGKCISIISGDRNKGGIIMKSEPDKYRDKREIAQTKINEAERIFDRLIELYQT